MLLTIEHRTHYTYSEPVNYTIQQLRLTPLEGFGQRVGKWEIRVNGNLHATQDTHGNATHMLVVDGEHTEISIIAAGEVETGLDIPPNDNLLPTIIYLRSTPLTTADAALSEFAAGFAAKKIKPETLIALSKAVIARVPYVKGSTEVETTAAKAFELGAGVWQDQAHVFITCCRLLGLPARYVSGYMYNTATKLVENHACVDVWLDASGWLSLDVANSCLINGNHVRLAVGLDYRDACPISGTRLGGGKETMTVSVKAPQILSQMQQTQ